MEVPRQRHTVAQQQDHAKWSDQPPLPTLTLPENNKYSCALGIKSPVPISVMGTTGTCAQGVHPSKQITLGWFL
jgi:hypothetical protein